MHALDRQPASEVIPPKRSLKKKNFLGFFHNSVVNTNLGKTFVLATQHLRPPSRGPRFGNTQHRIVNFSLVNAQFFQNCRGSPDEYPAIPIMLSAIHE